MNKNNISWIHYIYATITASVLAYVTAMDYSDKQADDTSAVDMLPPIFNENENEDENENENENENEDENEPPSDLYQDNSQLDNSSIDNAVDYEPPIAYPIESNSDESKNGGKLKKKKTKSKYITPKNNKTRSRK
jgi:hypothetical protein